MTDLYQIPESLKRCDGLEFHIVHGQVIRTEMWTEQHVSGGGNKHHALNTTYQKSIQTTIRNRKRIWLQRPDGKESEFVFDADMVSVAESHHISIITASRKRKEEPVAIINYTADASYNFAKHAEIWNPAMILIQQVLYGICAILGILAIVGGAVLGGVAMMLPFMIIMAYDMKKRAKRKTGLQNVIDDAARNTTLEKIKDTMLAAAA